MAIDSLTYVATLTRLLEGRRHAFVGGASADAAAASFLQRALSGGALDITMLGDSRYLYLSNDYSEVFNMAATGRFDSFLMSGGQIDGQGNVNLIGIGDHPRLDKRWAGSRGTPLLYAMIPNTILFTHEHTRRVLVPRVDYISAAATGGPDEYHPGGPGALITPLCLFAYDRAASRFRLQSVHKGHDLAEVQANTAFDFDLPEGTPPVTPPATPAMLDALRHRVLEELADVYPQYAERLRREVDAALDQVR